MTGDFEVRYPNGIRRRLPTMAAAVEFVCEWYYRPRITAQFVSSSAFLRLLRPRLVPAAGRSLSFPVSP